MECPPESLEWFAELSKDLRPIERYVYHVAKFGYHASVLCAKIHETVKNGSQYASMSPSDLLNTAEHLVMVTPDFLVPMISTVENPQPGHPDMKISSFGSISFRIFYCAFRMKLHIGICRLLATEHIHDLSPDVIRKKYQVHVAMVQGLADDILAVGPVLLPPESQSLASSRSPSPPAVEPERPRFWTDGLRVLWPFRQVAWNTVVREDQKALALETLQLLHDALGFPHAPEPPGFWNW